MSRLTRDGTTEPVSRDQIFRHVRGQGNIHFPCSADHEQDWQPYPVDPYSALDYVMTIEVTFFTSKPSASENAAGQLNHTEIKTFSSKCSNRRHVFFSVYPIRGLLIFLQQCRRWNN